MTYEVELKFPLPDPAAVRGILHALGALPKANLVELDVYLQHPARSFAQTDEALRVRTEAERVHVTYKGPKLDHTTKTREEIDLEIVSRSSGAADVLQLFERLGFQPLREVRKNRELFVVPWKGQETLACIDQIAELGWFIELELTVDSSQVAKSTQLLQELAARLNLQASERRSYLELLLDHDAKGMGGGSTLGLGKSSHSSC